MPTQHSGTKQDASVSSTGKSRVVRDGQEDAATACSLYESAVGFHEDANELGHALETWSDIAAQYCVSVWRKSQMPLSVFFATFRMKLVSGETFMSLDASSWRVEVMLN